jgi:hypothetical protein
MIDFIKKLLDKIKLFVLYWTRIVFVKNHFKCSLFNKLRSNIFGGYLADQYVLYDFRHNDKKEYLSEFDWYRSRYINKPFDFLMNNKIACNEILQQYVRVPEIYAFSREKLIADFDGRQLDFNDLCSIIAEHHPVFIKPYGKGKGNGVFRLDYRDNMYYADNKALTADEMTAFLKKQKNWMMCEAMSQHEYSSAIYDQTVNTIRLITLREPATGSYKIFFAVQRIGTHETIPVDNGSRGGLISKIDLETGTLSEARCLHSLEVHKVHPDSKAPIEGVRIPGWDNIKTKMLALANKLPYMYFVAWDILITPEDFCIIEANTSSGVNIIQLWGGQRNGELGDFYRYHKVIK